MTGKASEIEAASDDYVCETCEEWPECTPRVLTQDEEDTIYRDMVKKGFIPSDTATTTYADWEKSIRFMVRYGIIRLYDLSED